ncbi:hypothetical protein [Microbispora bryophytorum]|nr:hypothetical protein [Microbispora bryophytorum]
MTKARSHMVGTGPSWQIRDVLVASMLDGPLPDWLLFDRPLPDGP